MEFNQTIWLDKELSRCMQKDAVLASDRESNHRGGLNAERREFLRGFSPRINELCETSATGLTADPLPTGIPADTLSIGGYNFIWQDSPEPSPDHYNDIPDEEKLKEQPGWEYSGKGCTIQLRPGCDKNDAAIILEAICKVEKNILGRKIIADGRIRIRIGCPQREGRKDIARTCDYGGKHIEFVVTDNGSHLMAARARDAAGIAVEKTMLHELGHLLEPLLQTDRENLYETCATEFHKGIEAIRQISPHYLGQDTENIRKNLEVLEEARKSGKMINDGTGAVTPESYKRSWGKWLIDELFAETIRFHYLEPCLSGEIPKLNQRNTGWKDLDLFIRRLHTEAEINLGKTTIKAPRFPVPPNQPSHIRTGPIVIE